MRTVRQLGMLSFLGLAACFGDSGLPTSRPVGKIDLAFTETAPGAFVVTPVGTFADLSGVRLPLTEDVLDTCFNVPVLQFPEPPGEPQPLDWLDAGSTVTVSASEIGVLEPVEDDGVISYRLPGGTLPAVPGQPIDVVVPGGPPGGSDSYPASTLAARTITDFTLGAIEPAPDPEQDFTITWSPAGPTGSAMLIEMYYADNPNRTTPNFKAYCELKDDGSVTLPDLLAARWAASPDAARFVRAQRLISTFKNVGDGAVLVSYSWLTKTKSTFP